MNYGRMALEGRGSSTANKHASPSDADLLEAETVYRNALGLIKAMQKQNLAQATNPKASTRTTNPDSLQQNSAVLQHMMHEAESNLNRIATLRQPEASQNTHSESNQPSSQSPSNLCTIA